MNNQYQYETEELKVIGTEEVADKKKKRMNRLIPTVYTKAFDPIVLFEEYFIQPPAEFVSREHRQIEVINYLFSGGLDHKNQLDNKYTTLLEGELLKYVSGKGFVHSERPVNRGINQGVHIWFALPESMRNTEPSFQISHEKDFHLDEDRHRYIKTLVGENSPVQLHVEAEIKDILLYENSTLELTVPEGHNGFLYVISGINGELYVNNLKVKPSEALSFENIESIKIESRDWATRFLYVSAKPLGQTLPEVSEAKIK